MPSPKVKIALAALGWMLLGLALLLSGCAASLPPAPPTAGPIIPPMPAEAKQTSLPIYSASAESDISRWLQSLTRPSSPASPASAPTKR